MRIEGTVVLQIVTALLSLSIASTGVAQNAARPNVLLIAIDDLRTQLGCYGHEAMVTPHLDRLAAQGRMFRRHYVQVPTCGASRFSMLTGLRPSKSGQIGNGAFGRLSNKPTKQAQTMPELFRRHGYTTVCIGKISHQPDGKVYAYNGKGDGHPEIPFGWSDLATPYGKWKYGWGAFFGYASGIGRTFHPHPTPTEAEDVEDEGYPDGLLATAAIDKLAQLKPQAQPFFLALGLYKPHLPFNAPKKYWDLYDAASLPPSANPDKPTDICKGSWHGSGEMFGRYKHSQGRRGHMVTAQHAAHLRHGYFACVSYVDAQVGRVLAALDRLKLADNTIVVVWGDHGWHLGDHAIWGKHTTFERALRSAFLLRVPGIKQPGQPTDGIVESLDLYPTLADYCRLSAPDGLDGQSLRPLIDDPSHPGKDGALGYWKGRSTLRTAQWRITHYPKVKAGELATELYDHQRDPHETKNVAADHPQQVAQLLEQLSKDSPSMRNR